MKPTLLLLFVVGLVKCIPRERLGRGFSRNSPEPLPVDGDGDGSNRALYSSLPATRSYLKNHEFMKRGLKSFSKRKKEKPEYSELDGTKKSDSFIFLTPTDNGIARWPSQQKQIDIVPLSTHLRHQGYEGMKRGGCFSCFGKKSKPEEAPSSDTEKKHEGYTQTKREEYEGEAYSHGGQNMSKRGFLSKLKSKYTSSKRKDQSKNARLQGVEGYSSEYGVDKGINDDADKLTPLQRKKGRWNRSRSRHNSHGDQNTSKRGFISKLKSNVLSSKRKDQSKNALLQESEEGDVGWTYNPIYRPVGAEGFSSEYDVDEDSNDDADELTSLQREKRNWNGPRSRHNRYPHGELLERALRSFVFLSSLLNLNVTQNKAIPSANIRIKEVEEDQQAKEVDGRSVGQEGENEALGGKNDAQMDEIMGNRGQEDEYEEGNQGTDNVFQENDDNDDDSNYD